MKLLQFFVLVFILNISFGQNVGIIKGKVIDVQTREALPYVNILVETSNIGAITNEHGEFIISNVPLGYVKIQASFLGYTTELSDDYLVTLEKIPYIIVELRQDNEQLEEVVVKTKLFKKSLISPLSLQTLGIAEIEKNPGSDRDVLKVIQSFPGVASNPGFRNDIIIRGGAPSENKFYLDGVEVPVINHFQTQGTTGGPVGIINADLIRKTSFYSSSFQASRGNALSAIIEFTQKEGNPEKLNLRTTIGTSDAGISADGYIGKKTNFIMSVRQSYLQFIFQLLKLPFLPTYNDFQLNVKHRFSPKDEISLIALGAIDYFKLNNEVNEGITDEDIYKRNLYILNNLPEQDQWNYTVGLSYKHYGEKATQQLVFSRNELNNQAIKNENIENGELSLDYDSRETENKLRFENLITTSNNTSINLGVGLESAKYYNATFQQIATEEGPQLIDFTSALSMLKYSVFAQVSKSYFNSKLGLSVGLRMDGIDYNEFMKNPFNQLSPRLSLSYKFLPKWAVSTSAGIYYQPPAYTIMGFRDNEGQLVNRENGLEFIRAQHLVSGVEFNPNTTSKITVEGYYKAYDTYPFSVRDQISLANLGAEFGVVGNEEVTSTSMGRAYGFEVFAQKKSYSGFYGIFSYTYVISEFKDKYGVYIPATWDNKNLLTITAGKKLKKNWEMGAKFRYVGGKPYTPYDIEASSLIENYDINGQGILDYDNLNSKRYEPYNQLDVRIDKTWYWKHLALNVYVDVQNLLASEFTEQSFLIPLIDENGNYVVNPSDPTKYIMDTIENTNGTILPRFGLIFDF